jgi:hypothetical protein
MVSMEAIVFQAQRRPAVSTTKAPSTPATMKEFE